MLYKREASGVRPPHQAGNQVQLRNIQQHAERAKPTEATGTN